MEIRRLTLHLLFLLAVSAACAQTRLTSSGLDADAFAGQTDGQPTALYVLTNSHGVEACVTNYGARLVSLMVPDRDGRLEDVVLGFDSLADYRRFRQNFGATVGRYAGRVELNGIRISHGGNPGVANRVWEVVDRQPQCLRLRLVSPDGESGFPGELTTLLTYTLTEQDELILDYEATTTKPTFLNFTHHSFFNLSGQPDHDILDETLLIAADSIAEYSPEKNVTGRFLPVEGTPFDFRTERRIGDRIDADDTQLKVTKGYDHAFQLKASEGPAVVVWDPASGRTMSVTTTEPAAHIYTANGLKGALTGKRGICYPRRSAVCVETMHFAYGPSFPHFPSTELLPGNTFRSQTVYRFGVR